MMSRRFSLPLASRVIAPYPRDHGATRCLSDSPPRNGRQAVIAADSLALMDALHIERATVAGFDQGARAANVLATLQPGRCTATVSVSGYRISSQAAGRTPLPPTAEHQWCY
ncbi:alpha/beta fold hydrolase [Roseomonas fluvialis]|uniref:Uncharacterized protein n=1 Tax=Roseomonas fluvialis TaxID=1750527 RepID=A0ABM7Y8I9_9PROT|nr:alpha/beta hydrolase [Roseomonas fluvialis]BDG74339.1 hypothetical protein Rmf_42680 [Roseomonas fluvialis]